jgi:pyruvate ferredoxin oxidoreductase gamma subunit
MTAGERHMFEVRIHGRGGQGVVTAAELLSVAAFVEGRHAQAFPSFGSERTGAPVVAYCRIDDREIRTREPIVRPDAVIVQDATLLGRLPVFDGLRAGGYVLVNSTKGAAELELAEPHPPGARVAVVPASELARELVGRPVPNAALLGGFAAMSGLVSLTSVCTAIRERFAGHVADANVAAATRAFDIVRADLEERQHA